MGKPTRGDPLGTNPDPSDFGDMLNDVVDRRIRAVLAGRTDAQFDGVPDTRLVLELLARGWAVYRPMGQDPE